MINLIITGGSGMIGSRFTTLLPQDFRLLINLDRTEGFDILDLSGLKRSTAGTKADAIIHFAAFTNVSGAARQDQNRRGSCYQINVIGTRNITELARSLDCQLIHISTDFIFDGEKTGPYLETDQPNPIEWYGSTKFEAEKLVQNSNLKWCIARTAYPFVASFSPKKDLVRQRISQIKQGKLSPQFSDHILSPTFVDELSRALVTLVRHRPQGIYHLAGSSVLTDYELTESIIKIFRLNHDQLKSGSVEKFNQTALRPYQKNTALSNHKFEKQFGQHFSQLPQALTRIKDQGVDV